MPADSKSYELWVLRNVQKSYSDPATVDYSSQSSTTKLPQLDTPTNGWINGLPVEIMRKIFQKFVETDGWTTYTPCNILHDPVSDISPDPVILGEVCSSWRYVALSTPTLWSTIRVIPDYDNIFRQARKVLLCLERSKEEPLDLVLRDCIPRENSLNRISHPSHSYATRFILTLFYIKVKYWRSVDFHIPRGVLDVFTAIETSSPPARLHPLNLKSAFLRLSDTSCNGTRLDPLPSLTTSFHSSLSTFWKFFIKLPNLENVNWSPDHECICQDMPDVISSSRITHLTLHDITERHEFMTALKQFSNISSLTVLSVSMSGFWKMENLVQRGGPSHPVVLSSLRYLRLLVEEEVHGPLCALMKCPLLERFELKFSEQSWRSPGQKVKENALDLQRKLKDNSRANANIVFLNAAHRVLAVMWCFCNVSL